MLPMCTDLESVCWAMAKSWLYVQVDLELARSQPGRMDHYGNIFDGNPGRIDSSLQSSVGPENWPLQVLNQQPQQLSELLQKHYSSEMVHEAVTQGCKEQHRQIENTVVSTFENIKRDAAETT